MQLWILLPCCQILLLVPILSRMNSVTANKIPLIVPILGQMKSITTSKIPLLVSILSQIDSINTNKIPRLVPILSQMNSITTNKICLIVPILSQISSINANISSFLRSLYHHPTHVLVFVMVSFILKFSPKPHTHFFSFSCMLHNLPISPSFTGSF
jgi:hypothetical protein